MSDIRINVQVLSQAATASVSGLGREAAKADKSFDKLNVSIKQGGKFLTTFGGNLAAIGVSKAIGLLTQGFSTLSNTILSSTQSLETAATQFEVLTGSAGAANAIIKDLQEFTARTPFQFAGVSAAAQRLLSFGFTIDEVKTNLQDLGDVSAASGADIGELSLIFGQVRAAGKLTGERLLQLQERAIPIGPALAKSLGVAESSVRDLVSQGKVDFATFEAAFQSLNDTGEFAFGGIEKRSQTLAGRISTLRDNFELFAAGVGQRLAPALKAGTTALTEFIQQLSNDQGFNNFLDTVAGAIPGAVRLLANTLIGLIEVFASVRVTAGAVVGSLFLISSGALQAAESTLALVAATGKFVGIDTSGIDSARQSIENLKNAAAETASDIANDNREINASTQELRNTINSGADTLIRRYNEEKAAAEATANAVVEANTKKIESEQQFRTLGQLLAEQAKEREVLAREEALAVREAQAEEDFQFLQTNLGRDEAARVAAEAKRLENAGKTEQALKVLGDARVKAEQNRIKTEAELEKERVADRRDSLSTIATLQNSNNKTLATIGKAAALTQIAIDGPQAVVKALAAFPPPINFVAAAAVGAAVAAQAARVSGLAFQDGGIVPGNSFSGDNVFARVNSGEMILNRQQQATLFDIANSRGGDSGQMIETTTILELDGEVLTTAVSRSVANGRILGESGV